jgi:hypothetical protein
MTYTLTVWMTKAQRALENLSLLEDGTLTQSDIYQSGSTGTVLEAIAVERRNVAYCLSCGIK